MPAQFLVGEYNILWKALRHYEKHLRQLSANTDANSNDEDEQLSVDEDLTKLEGLFRDLQEAARLDWDLDLK